MCQPRWLASKAPKATRVRQARRAPLAPEVTKVRLARLVPLAPMVTQGQMGLPARLVLRVAMEM